MERNKSNKAIISLGSNIEPERNICNAKNLLRLKYKILSESTFIKTKPIGSDNQNDFLNGSVYIETSQNLKQLKTSLKNLERVMGRVEKTHKFAARIIDLDIIVWNSKIIDKDFYHRDYLKKTVYELIPHLKISS